MERHLLRSLIALFALISLTSPIFAQNTTLRGQVTDEVDAVIPGARVTLVSADGKERSVTAGGNGEFAITGVAPGTYNLTATFRGFQTYVQSGLRVAAGTAPLKIILTVAGVSVETDVSAETSGVSIEPDQNMSATVLGEEFIKSLPDNEDDLRDYLQALAGPAAGGGSGGQGGAEIYIDGFNGGRLPPKEAIQQIRINQNPFSAEFDRPGSNRIEIITKPGNDQWRGGFGFNYRNSALDARNAFALERPVLDQQRYNFNYGGPLISKKLSFMVFGDRNQFDAQGTVVATTLDGQYVTNVPTTNDSWFFGLRADYLLNNRNTLNVSYNYSRNERLNQEFSPQTGGGFGFGGGGGGGFGGGGGGFGGGGGGGGANGGNSFLLPERGSTNLNNEHTLRLGETFIVNSRLIHEARLELSLENSDRQALTQGMAVNVLDAFSGGGSPCCPNETKTFGLEYQDYVTYTLKKHTIKGGFQFEWDKVRDYSASNFNGTYTFSGLVQYAAAVNGVPGATATQFSINRGDPLVRYGIWRAGWFVQDDFRLSQQLTISFGLRHEFQDHLDDKNNFMPRFGFAWSPFKSRKTTIRGGGGIFYSRLTGGIYENTLRYDGVRQQSILIRNALYPDPFAGDPVLDIQNTITRTLDAALKAPYVINFNVSLEQQLPAGLVGTVTYYNTRGVHQFRARNINAPYPGTNILPFPDEPNIYQVESTANSRFNGLTFGLQRRFGQRFFFFSNYALSWSRNDADGAFSTPANNYDLRPEWGPASGDRRHTFNIFGSLTLPYGFRLTPFVTAFSGSPFNITTGRDDNSDTVINDRPAGVNRNSDLPASLYPGLPLPIRAILEQRYPDGVTARNPGFFNVNLSVAKTFGFGRRDGRAVQGGGGMGGPGGGRGGPGGGPGGGGRGGPGGGMGGGRGGMMMGGPMGGGNESSRFSLTLSAQVRNIFNNVNFGPYGGVLTSPYFGKSNSASSARQIELGLRFNF